MDTRLLEDALVLLEEGSFSAAAARRNVTQPAFSRRIRALEDWIGQELLIRGPNRITISPALITCEPQIRAMLAHLRQLRSALQNVPAEGEPLVFASQHSLSLSVFPEICEALASVRPGLGTRLRTQNQDIATSIFLRHEADVLIGYEYRGEARTPFDDSIMRYLWRRDALVPTVGGALRERCSKAGLLPPDCPVIRYPSDSYIGQIIAAHERNAATRLEGPTAVESAFSVGISRIVTAGVGASWTPHSIAHGDLTSGRAVILSADYGRIPLDIVLFVRRSNTRAALLIEGLSAAGSPDPQPAH